MQASAKPRLGILRSATYFPVSDVATAGKYYRDVFGFRCEYAAGDPPEFAIYSRDACVLMLRRVGAGHTVVPNERQGGSWDVFCWVADVDALHNVNGHVLGFGSETSGG